MGFREWYELHGKELNRKRKERYRKDPNYRQRVLETNQKSRSLRRRKASAERGEERQAQRLRVQPDGWNKQAAALYIEDGQKYFTIGVLAQIVGLTTQALRGMEARGFIPEPAHRAARSRDRLYTLEEMRAIYETLAAAGKVRAAKLRKRADPAAYLCCVRFADGSLREQSLFGVGALAKAIGRTVVTVGQMEARGGLPVTPFRSRGGARLYTWGQIATVQRALKDRDGRVRGDAQWLAFHEEVSSLWEELGVMGAQIEDGGCDE